MRKSLALFLLAAIAVMDAPLDAIAATVTFSVPTITLNESNVIQHGFFNAVVTETGGSDASIGFGVQVTTSSASVTFIGGDDNTSTGAFNNATYIYAGNTGNPGNGQVTPQDMYYSDVPNTGSTNMTSTPLGLMRVEYSIPAFFTGTADLTITVDPDSPYAAFWDDTRFNSNVPDAVVNGSITVNPVASPEPGSVVLLLLGAVGLFGYRRLRAQ
jgi:hypothetical protein